MGGTGVLLLAGVGSGLCGSVAGLASLVSYPALLAAGLPPVTANVTNCAAMTATTVGAGLGARPELRGQRARLAALAVPMAVGGLLGAVLLLTTPEGVFAAVVPWLVALGALLLLGRDRLREYADRARARRQGIPRHGWRWPAAMLAVGTYAGYFGAGSGVILLGLLAVRHTEALPVTNAVKNVGTGVANLVATGAFLLVAPVDLRAAVLLGAGALVGSWCGPAVVRRLPEPALRRGIGAAGLGLAAWLLAS